MHESAEGGAVLTGPFYTRAKASRGLHCVSPWRRGRAGRVRLHGEWKIVWYTKLLDVYTVFAYPCASLIAAQQRASQAGVARFQNIEFVDHLSDQADLVAAESFDVRHGDAA